jgi:hypothetical protein
VTSQTRRKSPTAITHDYTDVTDHLLTEGKTASLVCRSENPSRMPGVHDSVANHHRLLVAGDGASPRFEIELNSFVRSELIARELIATG